MTARHKLVPAHERGDAVSANAREPVPQGRQSIRANASGVIGKARRVALVVAVPLGFFAIWYAIAEAEIVGQIFIPHPQTIIDRVTLLWSELLGAIWVSLQMVVIGAFIGSVSGIFIGLLFGFSRLARDLFELTLDTIRPIPIFALIPLFVLWFGIGRTPQISLVALGVFLIVSFTTIEAVRNVPRIFVRAAMTCGASRMDVYRTVVIPSIVPEILLGIRFGLIAAWGLDVAAEFSSSSEGLGYFMIVRGQYLDTAGIVLSVLIFCGCAIVADRALRYLGRKCMPWNPRVVNQDFISELLGGRG
jgi:ABC-type nitrate/sulfonate/bicarbonate transport system permease component